jgi:hypothetical protein
VIEDFETVQAQLKKLADVLNAYKSEAVQLRLVELIFAGRTPAKLVDVRTEAIGSRAAKKRKRARVVVAADGTPPKKAPSRTNSSGRLGAKGTLALLRSEGFFKKPQTIASIVAYCEAHRASKFKQSDFSGALARLVRDKTLTRAKNAENQYEYTQP